MAIRKPALRVVQRRAPRLAGFPALVAMPVDPAAAIEMVRKGLPASAVDQAVEYFDIGQKTLLDALRIPVSSFHRKLARHENLSPADSEKVMRLAEVTRHAEETFGTPEAAREWLTTDNLALLGMPISLIDTEAGTAQIRRVLTGLDYGSVL